MLGTLLEKLFVSVGADLSGLDKAFKDAREGISAHISALDGTIGKLAQRFDKLGSSMIKVGGLMTATVTLPLLAFAKKSIDAWDEQEKAVAQVQAALKSTGGVAGRTLDQLLKQASELQEKTLFGDETILRQVTSNLLTFVNIHGKTFDRAQKDILDYAARLGTDLQSATIQVGRALNDPIRGVQMLSRAGVQFSDVQKKQIKDLVYSGQLYKAQALILKELENQFGGAAEAAAKAGTGPFKQFKNAIGDLGEVIGGVLMEVIKPLTPMIRELTHEMLNADPAMVKMGVTIAAIAAAIGPVVVVLGVFTRSVGILIAVIPTLIGVIVSLGRAFIALMVSMGPIGIALAALSGVLAYLILTQDGSSKAAEQHEKSLLELNKQVADAVGKSQQYRSELATTIQSHITSAEAALKDAEAQREFARAAVEARMRASNLNEEQVQALMAKQMDNSLSLFTQRIEKIKAEIAQLQGMLKTLTTPVEVAPTKTPDPTGGFIDKKRQKRIDSLKAEIWETQRLLEINNLSGLEYETQAELIRREAEARKNGNTLTQQEIELIKQLVKVKYDLKNATKSVGQSIKEFFDDYYKKAMDFGKATKDFLESTMNKLEDALTNFIMGQKVDWKELVNSIIKEFLRLYVIRPLLASIFGAIFGAPGAGGGIFGSIFGGLFGGLKAGGGVVPPWKSFVAGERGAELIEQDGAGAARRVIPAGRTRQMLGASARAGAGVIVQVMMPPGSDFASFKRNEGLLAATVARAVDRGRRNQ